MMNNFQHFLEVFHSPYQNVVDVLNNTASMISSTTTSKLLHEELRRKFVNGHLNDESSSSVFWTKLIFK